MEYRVVKAWPSYSIGNTIAEGDLPPKSIAAMLKEGVIEPIATSQVERIEQSERDE